MKERKMKIKMNKLEKTLIGIFLAGTGAFILGEFVLKNNILSDLGKYSFIIAGSKAIGYRWGREDSQFSYSHSETQR
jgi:hypothetical protein